MAIMLILTADTCTFNIIMSQKHSCACKDLNELNKRNMLDNGRQAFQNKCKYEQIAVV